MKHTESTSYENSTLSSFAESIKKYGILSSDEVKELSSRIQEGDLFARNKLVNHNLRFVIAIAKKYRNQGVPFMDLIEAGTLGLINSANNYVFSEDTKFLSYAVLGIRRSILKEISNMSRVCRIPAGVLAEIIDLNNRVEAGEVLVGDEVIFHNSLQPSVSLDAPLTDDEGGEYSDYLMGQISGDLNEGEENVIEEELCDLIRCEMSRVLNNREFHIIEKYFGFDGSGPSSLEKVGNGLGLSRERIRVIMDQALSKLKRSSPIFKYYLDNGPSL